MFRGTLKWNTLIATLQMVNRLCDAAIYLPDEELNEGEILRIDRQGRRKVETFNTGNLYDGRFLFDWPKLSCGGGDDGYVRELKPIAGAYGYTAKDVDTFLSYGMYPEEIEEIMCCGEV